MQELPTGRQVVAAALIDREGRVLMQRRREDAQHGGLWEFPGGKVEPAETRRSALVRELREELGVEVRADDLARSRVSVAPSEPGSEGLVLILYTCRAWKGEPQCLDGAEIRWCSVIEARELSVPPLDRPLLADLATIIARSAVDLP